MMNYLDLSYIGATYGDGSDHTEYLREAINLIRKGTHGWGLNQRYCGISISGPIRTRNIPELSDYGGFAADQSPQGMNGINILLSSKWELDETLEAVHLRLIGVPWYSSAQFTQSGCSVLTPGPNMPDGSTVLRLLGSAGCTIENIDIAYRRGVGIESWGAIRTLRHVSIATPAGRPESAGYPALVMGNGFWLTLDHVNCARYPKEKYPSLPGYPDNAVAIIGSDISKPDPVYTGMVEWRNSICIGGTILIGSMDPTHAYGSHGIRLSNIITEYDANSGAGEDFATTRGYVQDLTIDRCAAADSHGTVGILNNTGDLYGCWITGRHYNPIKGNHIHGLVWDVSSAAPFLGLALPGAGSLNGIFFGPHEDDAIRQITAVVPQEWELPLVTALIEKTHRGADLTADSAFVVQPGKHIELAFPGLHLSPGDAFVCKVMAQVEGDDAHLDGGEVSMGFQNATIQNGKGGETNYIASSFRSWPFATSDLRKGGHWRELIVAAIVHEVSGDMQYVQLAVKGIARPTRFWNPRWWRIPAGEWNGLEHLKQLIRHSL